MKKVGLFALVGMVMGSLIVGPWTSSAQDVEKGQPEPKVQKVTLAQLPVVVSNALVKATEGGAIKEIEKEVKDGKTVYAADVTKDGKEMEITLDETGKVLNTKAADGDKEEKEKD